MASVTLLESAKLGLHELVAGVIEAIVTVNRFFEVGPQHEVDDAAAATVSFRRLSDLDDS